MTLKIEILIPEALVADGTGSAYLSRAMKTLGYIAPHAPSWRIVGGDDYSPGEVTLPDNATIDEAGAVHVPASEPIYDESGASAGAGAAPLTETPKRERGKPGEGRARRTKAEIAEDEASDKADAAEDAANEKAAFGSQTGITITGQTAVSADEAPLISSGEERVGPEDDAETQAQDKADEAAEAGGEDKPASLDDIRNALGDYVTRFGMPAAQEDGPKLIKMVCGDAISQISKVPEDKISAVHSGILEMLAKNPFKRAAVDG